MSNLLSSLNEQQRQVVTTPHGPVLVLAGAGSGKTRALTHRIAYLIEQGLASPYEIMAVTFTNKAAGEMKARVAELVGNPANTPPAIGTFHGLGAKMLREQEGRHARTRNFTIFDARDSEKLVRTALKEQNLSLREWQPAKLKQQISKAKNMSQSPEDIQNAESSPADEVLAKTYKRYEELLARHNAYDFDDLLLSPLAMLEQDSSVRSLYQSRWRFLSVDEFQDTNPIQNRLLHLLTNAEKNICVVGDDYQSIYSWRGADVDHILTFETDFPGCTTIYLTQNYRSTPQILEAANKVISTNTRQKHKELWTDNLGGNPVQLISLASDKREAAWVREQIQQHKRQGGRLQDCVVLYRTNAQSRLLEEEFLMNRIPYSIIGGFRFYERREVKDALAFLHLSVNPNSRISVERISDALLERVGPKTIDRWETGAIASGATLLAILEREAAKRPQLAAVTRSLAAASHRTFEVVSDLLRHLLQESGYIAWLLRQNDGEERMENIEELYNVTSTYSDIHLFLEEVALLSDIDSMEENSDRVTCMTLHASKGLEFPAVFLVGCEEGLLPHANSLYESAALEEERRLLYVGMTRARKNLYLSYATARYMGGEMSPQTPSRFLQELPETIQHESEEYADAQHHDTDIVDFITLPQAEAAPATSREPIIVSISEGEFITHPQFGRGVVISIQETTVTCVFEGHGVKQISHSQIS